MVALHPPKQQRTRTVRAIWESLQESEKPECALEDMDLTGIDWVIAGGESGPGARPMNPDWVRSIRDQCLEADIAFHFKQWGGVVKKKTGRILDGRTWDEFPASLGA